MDSPELLKPVPEQFLPEKRRYPKVVSVTSGKGGVGKTNIVANMAVSLAKKGKQVVILDADLGLGNVDILFGMVPPYTLEHVFMGEKSLAEVMVHGPCGIHILPSGSGLDGLTNLTQEQKLMLLSEFDRLEKDIDVFLIDTSAGISSNVLYFNVAAEEIIVVASSEPTSLTDAYAMMKVLSTRYGEKHFKLLVNMVRTELEAKETFRKLSLVSDRYLDISIDYIGYIPDDDYLRMAVNQQRAVVDIHPKARSSQHFNRLARKVLQWPVSEVPKGNIQFLWRRLLESE